MKNSTIAFICGVILFHVTAFSQPSTCTGFKTFPQGDWGSDCKGTNTGCYRDQNFSNVFPTGIVIGCSGGKQLTLTTSAAVNNLLPANGTSAKFIQNYTNPTTTTSGTLVGQLVSLTLNIEFDKKLSNFTPAFNLLKNQLINYPTSPFHGKTVEQFLALANQVIGGCSSAYSISDVNTIASIINTNYTNGAIDNGYLTCPPLKLSVVNSTNNPCAGNNKGAIDLFIEGGFPLYTIQWSNGKTSEDINNLVSGVYTVIVTDAAGTKLNKTVEITEPKALSSDIDVTNVNCFGENSGALSMEVTGGVPPYKCQWSNGAYYQLSNPATYHNLPLLTSGPYSVLITDANLCTSTNAALISQPNALTISESHINVSCFDGNNGSIDITPNGGTVPYSYSWSNGETSEDLNNLKSGQYIVTVTDAHGCVTNDTIEISQPELLTFSDNHKDVSCFDGSNGSIDINVTGGTKPYSYSWSNGESTEDLSNLFAGKYTITITDAHNCVAYDTIEITQPELLTSSETHNNVLCFEGNNGTIDLKVTGGTTSYSYGWSNGESTEDLNNLTSGIYTVTITDTHNCVTYDTIEISQPALLTTSDIHNNVSCFEGNNGAIELTVSGGTESYSISWSNGETTENLSNLIAGIYSVSITDAHNCVAYDTIEITQPELLTSSDTHNDVSCFEGTNGAIDLTVSGGTEPYSISWSNGETTEDLSNLISGNYSVSITDAHNCVANDTIEITQPELLTSSDTHNDVSCFEGSNGAIDLSVTGGTTPYTINWSNGYVSEDLNNLTAGIYSVAITDTHNCVAYDTIEITQPELLTYSDTHNDVSCFEGSNGAIDLSVTGGTTPYTINWSNAYVSEDLNNLTAGIYSVAIIDAHNCVAYDTIEIAQPELLTSSDTHNDVSCFEGTNGAIDLSVTGGTTPYTINWSNGYVSEDLNNLTAGTYTVTITDAHNCVVNYTIQIIQPVAALTSSETHDDVLCFAGNNGSINLTVNGGTESYSYRWSNGESSQDLSYLNAGTYFVTITDAHNCIAYDTINIIQPVSPLSSSETHTNVSCFNGNNGAIDLSVNGGTTPYSYSWSNSVSTQDLSGLTATTYNVIVTDAHACTINRSITISQPNALSASASPTMITCFGAKNGSINISVNGGTTPYTYLWSNGITTEDLSGLAPGTFSISITDNKGCSTAVNNIAITQPAKLNFSETHIDATCYGGSTGAINITINGGTTPYSFSWSNGSKNEDLSSATAGNYAVLVTDANACTINGAVTIGTAPASGFTNGTIADYTKNNGTFSNALKAWSFASPNNLIIGNATGNNRYTFTSSTNNSAIMNYLDKNGTVKVLPAGQFSNPANDHNLFASEVIVLNLNIKFNSPSNLGNLTIGSGKFEGKTVSELLSIANQALGTGALPTGITLTDISNTVGLINSNYTSILVNSCGSTSAKIAAVAEEVYNESSSFTTYPNPFIDNATIAFTLIYNSTVILELYNFEGVHVTTIYNGNVNANEKIQINLSGANLSNGVYYCRLVTNNGTMINKLVLMK